MKFKHLTLLTGCIAFFVGLLFLLRLDIAFNLYGISLGKLPKEFWLTYFKLKGFAQMFGATLMSIGAFAWAVSKLSDRTAHYHLSIAFFLSLLMTGLISLAGFIAFWETKFAGGLTATFFLLAMGYAWLMLQKETPPNEEADSTFVLRERWAQQIGEAAAQQERNRLARELHDSVKQQLFSIQVCAATTQARWDNDVAGAREALSELRNRTRDALSEMEAMLQNLRPTPLANFGLVEALRRECEALRHRTGAQVETRFNDLPDELEFPPGAPETLFRITQEAFSNIARHARAQHVSLTLDRHFKDEADTIRLRINDNGIGFSAAQSEGMGLGNMRVRAAQHHGNLQLESFPSHGTKLTVQLPLESAPLERSGDRELMLATLFTLVAFFGFGYGVLLGTNFRTMIWVGIFLYGVSAFFLYLVNQRLKQLENQVVYSFRQVFEMRLSWYYGLALWLGLFLVSLVRWLVIISGSTKSKVAIWLTWNLHLHDFILPEFSFGSAKSLIVPFIWIVALVLLMTRIHRQIKRQAPFYSVEAFGAYLKRLWRYWSRYFLIALMVPVMLYAAIPLKALLWLLAYALLWLHLSWVCIAFNRGKAEVKT